MIDDQIYLYDKAEQDKPEPAGLFEAEYSLHACLNGLDILNQFHQQICSALILFFLD